MERVIKNTDEWEIKLEDKYYLRKVEELKASGIPRCVGIPAMIKLEREKSAQAAYN